MNGLTLMTLNRKTVLALSVVLLIALWSGVAYSADIVTVTSDKNIVEAAQGTGIFTTLLAAAKTAGLADILANTQNITVFAPNDAAFAALPAGFLDGLLKPENQDLLVKILSYHVVPFRVNARDLVNTLTLRTLFDNYPLYLRVGGEGTVNIMNGAPGSCEVKGIVADKNMIEATNGNIYVIDTVLTPWKACSVDLLN